MGATTIQEEQLPVLDNLKKSIFKELNQRIKTFSEVNLITFNNGWLAGLWQGDGGLYVIVGSKFTLDFGGRWSKQDTISEKFTVQILQFENI